MRGFRFRSSLKKWPEEKASPLVYTKTCHPAKAPRRAREKTSGTQDRLSVG